MVDAERLRRLLQRVSDNLARLEPYADGDRAALLADEVRLGYIKYLFMVALEGCINVAQHLAASEGWGPPQNNADAMAVLGRHGVLSEELAKSMERAVGFRNLLVHQYAEVDDRRVIGSLDSLGDLRAFVGAVAALVLDADTSNGDT